MIVSAAIATHNPIPGYLTRCLRGLQQQTLKVSDWELIIVDNKSNPPLLGCIDLTWHPNSRVVVEDRLGLAFARCRSFTESKAELIVNVDDDCILDKCYLENVVKLSLTYPFIGVFGSQISPEFEVTPTMPLSFYNAAERIVTESVWSNQRENMDSTPWGVGSVVRRTVADRYVKRVKEDPRLLELGRRGNALLSCEDIDIANSACDVGLGKGVFKELMLTHLIRAKRMTEEFQIENSYWNNYSAIIHNFLQYGGRLPTPRSWQNRLNIMLQGFFRDRVSRRKMRGELKAEQDATREIKRRRWI